MATSDYLVRKMLNSHITVTVLVTLTATLSIVINGIVTGRYLGPDALTSFGMASPMLILLSAFAGIFSNGGTITCAKYMGRGDHENVKNNFSLVTYSSLVIGAVYGAFCILCGDAIGDMLGGGENIQRLTGDYIRSIGISSVPFLLLQNFLLYLRIDNNQRLTIIGMIVSVAVNAGFAVYSSTCTDLGLFGIGLSMALGNLVGLFVTLFHFRRKERMLGLSKPVNVKKELYDIFMSGLPTAINRGSQTIKNLVLNIFLLTFGTTAVLTLSVQTNVYQFLIAISSGYGIMVATMVGMFVGERDKTAIRDTLKVSIRSGFIVSAIAGVILFIFAEPIAGLFLKTGGDLAMATDCLKLFALSQPTSTVALIFLYLYQSMGNLVLSNVVSLARGALYVILISVVFAPIFGLNGVWLSFFFADILSIATVVIMIKIKTGRFPRKLEDFIIAPNTDFNSEEICNFSVRNDISEVMGLSQKIDTMMVEKGIDTDKTARLSLCIEELAGNIVDHGFKDDKEHYIDIRIIRNGDDLIMRIRDDGVMFNPLKEEHEGHLGIKTVRATAKSIKYRYGVGLNNLVVTI